ncbi:metallophosphoesterase family protein [Candidatus Bipolaricaulota bacterium]|nr:metallophosphoesterase family protein [Candidatus Bipolaricaulota bacterium]
MSIEAIAQSTPARTEPALARELSRARIHTRLRAGAAIALAIGLGLVASLSAWAQLASPWEWGPIVGGLESTAATVTWSTSRPAEADLVYGEAAFYDATGLWQETLSFGEYGGLAEVRLDGLLPGTTYRYQVMIYDGDAVYSSAVNAFATVDPSARSGEILVYGNTLGGGEWHRWLIGHIASGTASARNAGARWLINVGGVVDEATADAYGRLLDDVADGVGSGSGSSSFAYAAVRGDVEALNDLYYDVFALPTGGGTFDEQWWSLDIGGVHVVALDTSVLTGDGSWPVDAGIVAEQLRWLQDDLAGSRGLFNVVLLSEPIIASCLPDGENESLRTLLEDIFRQGEVRVVISGGVGYYEHSYARGIHYLVTGGGGGYLLDGCGWRSPCLVMQRFGSLHYLRLTVADNALQMEAVPVGTVYEEGADSSGNPMLVLHPVPDGQPFDSFTLRSL